MSERKCSLCKQVGHNKRSEFCPVRKQAQNMQLNEKNREIEISEKMLADASANIEFMSKLSMEWVIENEVVNLQRVVNYLCIILPNLVQTGRQIRLAMVNCSVTELTEKLNKIVEIINDAIRARIFSKIPEPVSRFTGYVAMSYIYLTPNFVPYCQGAIISDGYLTVCPDAEIEVSIMSHSVSNIRRQTFPILSEQEEEYDVIIPVKRTAEYLKECNILNVEPTTEDDAQYDCPICFDSINPSYVIRANCDHGFCLSCMKGHMKSIKDKTCRPTCPCCRGEIKEFKIISRRIIGELYHNITKL
jgi:hypothetical protein